MPAMAIVPDAETKDAEEQQLPPLLFDSQRLYDLGCAAIGADSYEEAIDCFSKALEIRVNHFGELAPECATTYYKYGIALLYKVQAESDPLCDKKEEPPTAQEETKEEVDPASAGGSKKSVDEEAPEDDADGDSEGGGDDIEEDIEDEEGDIELAWKLLETARVIHSRQPTRTLDEVDVIIALGDISLEKENFKTCYADYEQALHILQDLVEPDSRFIASLWYKMALAKQFDTRPQEALESCQKAVSLCNSRLQRLYKEQEKLKATEGDAKGATDEGEKKPVSDEPAVENGGGAAKEEMSKAQALDAEVREIEESLVDLKEKVEELKQMVTAPSLLEALKAENPEAANMMTEAVGEVFKKIGGVETTSSSSGPPPNAAFPGSSSSSAEPVTHLGVVGRGIKRATPIPIPDQQLLPPDVQPAKRTSEALLTGGGSGETQIGFGGGS